MTDKHQEAIEMAIREAVHAAVADYGIDFVRTLSMFPSSQSSQASNTKIAA